MASLAWGHEAWACIGQRGVCTRPSCRGFHDRAGRTMQEVRGLASHLEPAGRRACR